MILLTARASDFVEKYCSRLQYEIYFKTLTHTSCIVPASVGQGLDVDSTAQGFSALKGKFRPSKPSHFHRHRKTYTCYRGSFSVTLVILIFQHFQISGICFFLVQNLLNCSQRTKFLVAKQIALRLHCLMYLLVDNIWSAYPMNILPDSSPESAFDVFYRLAPLLADYVASSDCFWTAGLSKNEANRSDPLDRCIGKLFYRIGELAIMGHTNSDIIMTQANQMMDFFDVFLLHSEWKTRIFGLILMNLMICHVSAFWKTDDAAEALRVRLKRRLCDLLADPWIDVAQKASNTLTYALQLSIFQYDEQWFRQLAKQSRQKLINPRAGSFSKQEKEAAMLRRHAGVLGLCSIVRAHPHDTPDYLPAVIAEVADHSADPYPIAKSVSDTLMEYSRNHTDQWATQDRAKFSEEQLEAYMSVVSGVSYYV